MPQSPTLAQVLASGNTVPADGEIAGENGGASVSFPEGCINIVGPVGGRVRIDETGAVSVHSVGGGTVYLAPEGWAQVSAGNAQLTLFPDGRVEFGALGLSLGYLPASDPHQATYLWNDNGLVRVSPG